MSHARENTHFIRYVVMAPCALHNLDTLSILTPLVFWYYLVGMKKRTSRCVACKISPLKPKSYAGHNSHTV